MLHKKLWLSVLAAATGIFLHPLLHAVDSPPPAIIGVSASGGVKQIQWEPYPAAVQYKIYHAPTPLGPFSEDRSGAVSGYNWTASLASGIGFYKLQVEALKPDELLATQVLNRLAYGPTPDELERVKTIGADAYIREQLAPETIQENLVIDALPPPGGPAWQYVTATGTGSSSVLYIYLTEAGDGYIDDVKLVAGTVPEAGANLLRNGDFEAPLATNDWVISDNHLGSERVTDVKHSGSASLHLVATSGGSTRASAIFQDPITPSLNANQQYTLSYWFLPGSTKANLTVRLSGSGITSSPSGDSPFAKLVAGTADLATLRAWHIMRAVQSKRQLLEVLDQFLENHFVTQHSKSREYFDTYYNEDTLIRRLATQMEFKENQRWRQALLNPKCTFYDLLLISAESPAMIIYLDTVNSRGDGKNIANENYARELLELFTFGVDNGYDQNDITVMSRAWTGWSANIVDADKEFNPLAPRSTTVKPGVTTNLTTVSNLVGVWTFNYKQDRHNTAAKTIFPGKVVPDRFGPPYAGKSYELVLPARTGTNGIQDGYQVIRHLADQPFTQEFISIKLCRLFVHDDFPNPSNDPANPNYDFYNYAAGNLSPEAALVRECMRAWENGSPKGQIRDLLTTIFNSELFRSHGGSLQKVKTPLEFLVSSVRALRAANGAGGFTADTDGTSMIDPMKRMGGMNLFDRAEPDGYPESAGGWISAGTLAERLRFVQSLLIARGQGGKGDAGDNNVTDPVALLKLKLPVASQTDAAAVADYFLSILYPAEGRANLDAYRAIAINYLNTANDGVTASPLASVSMTGTPSPYDTRIRGLVGALLTFQRFQEQ